MTSTRLRLGTRASALARWQADWVAARIGELGVEVELVPISTIGDREQQGPIGAMGGQGVFTKEIQRALLDDRIDLAVHSLKDLPTEKVDGLCLAAVPERAPCGDALVSCKYDSLDALPKGAILGTGSLRRRSQILHVRPDLRTKDIRGNVETRVQKVDDGEFDALILAEAGLLRLGLGDRITQTLPMDVILPAIGQGALGLETRTDDALTRGTVEKLTDPVTFAAVLAERAMLLKLQGGCLAPIAAWGRLKNEELTLSGRVLSTDGTKRLESVMTGSLKEPEQLGRQVAAALLDQGAADLVSESRDSF